MEITIEMKILLLLLKQCLLNVSVHSDYLGIILFKWRFWFRGAGPETAFRTRSQVMLMPRPTDHSLHGKDLSNTRKPTGFQWEDDCVSLSLIFVLSFCSDFKTQPIVFIMSIGQRCCFSSATFQFVFSYKNFLLNIKEFLKGRHYFF